MAARHRPRLAALVAALAAAHVVVASVAGAVVVDQAHGSTRQAALLPPIAVDDSGSVVHGRLRTVPAPGVLGNDLQLGGGYTAVLVSGVSNGTLTLRSNGSYDYRSDADYVGTDTFRYRIDGGLLGLSNTATVTITVTNAAPVASGDSYTAQAGVARSIAAPGVLANDSDADGDPISASLVSGPSNGTLSLSANGGFTYTADAGFGGTDTFRYRATDGIAASGTVTVQMTVTAPTPKPTPAPTPTPSPTPIVPIPSLLPTPLPSVSLPPLPGATASPTPSPSPRPGGSGGPAPSASPSPTSTGGTGQGGAAGPPGGGSDPSAPPSGPLASPVPADGPFAVDGTEADPEIELDPGSFALASFDWAVPVMTLTVPGLFLIVAIVAQATLGIAWIPIARRSLELERRRRRTYVRAG